MSECGIPAQINPHNTCSQRENRERTGLGTGCGQTAPMARSRTAFRQLCRLCVLARNDQILENLHGRKADNSAHQVKPYLAYSRT